MNNGESDIQKRSNERLRYAVDVSHKAVNDAFKIFSIGKKPYHQLFSDVCQDISAQLDTLNLLIQPLIEVAPKYDFEDIEANGVRSLLSVVDCVLKELIIHLHYCTDKHTSFFFNGTNSANKLARFCALLSRLGKLLDIATLIHQNLGGDGMFLEVSNPVGSVAMREFEGISRECFYGDLIGLQFVPSVRTLMRGICVAQSSYGIGYYATVPSLLSQPGSMLWRGSAGLISGAKFLFREEERAKKFVELTDNCATIEFTKSFWGLVDRTPLAEVPRIVHKDVDIAVEIFIRGEPLYVRNKHGELILLHPPIGDHGSVGVTVGFLSSRLREGQIASPPLEGPPPPRFPKAKRLIVHFHGGGFVAGSHVQHEGYLRSWCRELDSVIVSVNYSLAPESPFPKGLDDCVFAYAWCLENLHTLGCTGQGIVFVGDSAGGNLAIATAMRADSYGLRVPEGILAAYPVTYVKYSASVSRLLSTLDILLPPGVLQCCLRAYSGVPVLDNDSFSEWAHSEHNMPSQPTQVISDNNSSFIHDICRGYSDEDKQDGTNHDNDVGLETRESETLETQHSDDVTIETIETIETMETMETMESDNEPPVDLDTIKINPIVFEDLNQESCKTNEDQRGPKKTNDVDSTKEDIMVNEDSNQSDEITIEQIINEDNKMLGETATEETDNEEDETKGDREETLEDETNQDETNQNETNQNETNQDEVISEEAVGEETTEGEAYIKAPLRRLVPEMKHQPSEEDLEKMLYEDNDTKFKGAKLVLTPNEKSEPVTPVTPTKVLKRATVLRQESQNEARRDPVYVINPGELATQRNSTLLQKYFNDPFMSPFLADSETLASLPPVHIVAAEYDPLLDDSVAFSRKMKQAGGDITLQVIPGMTHGFLNLVLSNNACHAASQTCLIAISNMFKDN